MREGEKERQVKGETIDSPSRVNSLRRLKSPRLKIGDCRWVCCPGFAKIRWDRCIAKLKEAEWYFLPEMMGK